jgi:hypothetical protein
MDLHDPVENPLREASYDPSGSRGEVSINSLGRSHHPCSYYGMKFNLNCHPDGALHTSGLHGEDAAVMDLDAVPQVATVFRHG